MNDNTNKNFIREDLPALEINLTKINTGSKIIGLWIDPIYHTEFNPTTRKPTIGVTKGSHSNYRIKVSVGGASELIPIILTKASGLKNVRSPIFTWPYYDENVNKKLVNKLPSDIFKFIVTNLDLIVEIGYLSSKGVTFHIEKLRDLFRKAESSPDVPNMTVDQKIEEIFSDKSKRNITDVYVKHGDPYGKDTFPDISHSFDSFIYDIYNDII